MLPKEELKTLLEKVMGYPKYVEAKNLRELLYATIRYLYSLRKDTKFKMEFGKTNIYYRNIYTQFKEVAILYERGDMVDALRQLSTTILDNITNDLVLKKDILKRGSELYRMRKQDGYRLFKRIEMFHMPTNMTNKLANARYSLNGFPCLYLGTSLYVCWEELRRPDIVKTNYVKMVANEDICVYSTLCPEKFNDRNDVIQFVLFALCSKVVPNDSDSFQYVYAFPELVLLLLIHYKKDTKEPYGIKYVSSRYFNNDGDFTSEGIFYNYVLPVYGDCDDDHLCIGLRKAFKVSETKALYAYQIYGKQTGLSRCRPNEYTNTLFHRLEKDIVARKRL